MAFSASGQAVAGVACASHLVHGDVGVASSLQIGDQLETVRDWRRVVVRPLNHNERRNVLAHVGHGVDLFGNRRAIGQACGQPAGSHAIDLGLDVGGPVSVDDARDGEVGR